MLLVMIQNYGNTPQSRKSKAIRIATYNILDVQNNHLIATICVLDEEDSDIAFLTVVKIPAATPIHTRSAYGYTVFVSYSTVQSQGGIALVLRSTSSKRTIESSKWHGPNIISCLLVTGNKSTPLIGAYLPPSHLDNLPHLMEALNRYPHQKPILMGDLNIDMADPTAK
jgi:exonuclease III